MCLELKRFAIKRIALRNRIVYKHLIRTDEGLKTPYRHTSIEIGKTYTSSIIKHKYIISKSINKAIHSFINMEDAEEDMEDMNISNNKYRVIVKCVIPIGSRYYKGRFNRKKSIASNKIKYLEIIKEYSDK